MSELCQIFARYYSPRTIMRYMKPLIESGQIQHGRIKGYGKRKRYFVRVENTKHNLLHRTVQFKNKNNWKAFRDPITQRQLSANISWEMRFYRKEELKEWKRAIKEKTTVYYVHYHVVLMIDCLRWISQITWAIQSGMLGNSQPNVDLAYRNQQRYEEFLKKIIYNLNARNEKIMETVSIAIYHLIMDSLDFSTMTMGTPKGKFVFQFDKKKMFKTKL